MEGIEHGLIAALQVFGDVGRTMAAGTRQQNLGPAEGEGVTGLQPGL